MQGAVPNFVFKPSLWGAPGEQWRLWRRGIQSELSASWVMDLHGRLKELLLKRAVSVGDRPLGSVHVPSPPRQVLLIIPYRSPLLFITYHRMRTGCLSLLSQVSPCSMSSSRADLPSPLLLHVGAWLFTQGEAVGGQPPMVATVSCPGGRSSLVLAEVLW